MQAGASWDYILYGKQSLCHGVLALGRGLGQVARVGEQSRQQDPGRLVVDGESHRHPGEGDVRCARRQPHQDLLRAYIRVTKRMARTFLFLPLLQKLAGRETEVLLERASEVLGVFEAEEVGGLGDGLAVAQVGGGFLHDKVADDGGGSLAGGLTDEVAEVVGREEQFLGTITDGGQAERALAAFAVIAAQQVVEAFQQVVVGCGLGLNLPLIEDGAILQNQFEIGDDDAAQVFVVGLRTEFLANHLEADFYRALFVGRRVQRLAFIVGEEMVVVDTPSEVCAVQQLWREQQHPALDMYDFAIVAHTARLSRSRRCERTLRGIVAAHAVGRADGKVVLHEDGIHAHLVQRVANLAQLVEVYDAHHRVKDLRPHIQSVVIGVVDVQEIIHGDKGTNK